MNQTGNGKNLSDTGLQSFKIDKPLQVIAIVVSLLAVSLYGRLMALSPWSWLARGGSAVGLTGLIAVHLIVLCAMAYLLFGWMKRRTTSATLTLAGLVLVLFIKYPILQNGPLAFFLGPLSPVSRKTPSVFYWIGYYVGLYAGLSATMALALWANYLVYSIARRHGIQPAMAIAVGIWGFYFGPMLHGPSSLQAILLSLAAISLGALTWWPSAAALKTFTSLTVASSIVGIVLGGLSNPVFTAFGLRRVTLVPLWMISTGVLGAAVAAVLALRRGARQAL